jgi:hypothetical protein
VRAAVVSESRDIALTRPLRRSRRQTFRCCSLFRPLATVLDAISRGQLIMASAFQEDRSHLEADTPRASAHGAGALTGDNTAEARPSDISETDHVQEKVPQAPIVTKREKFQRHCGRFKWWYLAGFLIFLIIFLPIL